MTWFVNYTLNTCISPADRGLAYGDGVFETIHANQNGFVRLSSHLTRLYKGLEKLLMAFDVEQKEELSYFLRTIVSDQLDGDSVVKIMVTRGQGGRGYQPPKTVKHTIVIGILPFPNYQAESLHGVGVSLSPIPVNSNSYLAGIKHLNRLEHVIAKQYLASDDFEAIMLDCQGYVIEGIQSNVFWFKDGLLCTPNLDAAGVEGTYRQAILAEMATQTTLIGNFTAEHLLAADEVFMANSLMKIVPVIRIGHQSFTIGANTKNLQSLMQAKDMHGIH
ncbi:aminodeoxychorismate lyase [Marinomonas posidonica]|uniref:Aminodeoxychorismate lyase n=1 Tax=Marinomonas posidonica (strain CECT 7376 / NCIMB 14433 / IVIA-Po-181) TaxID=491952 RepID=F6CZY9_MARPP|nr:aminodeoxychorismate lyase [Marinomonas posidonica]AEF54729.1 aminodeoxychorismate lyase [Marinomonas posidonica IVIA-Po-181]